MLKREFFSAPHLVRDHCLHVKRAIVFLQARRQPNVADPSMSGVLNQVFSAIERSFVEVVVH